MVQSTLPAELRDAIINCLVGEKAALARCSLVCKPWAVRSRQSLWREIFLHCASDASKPSLLLDLLRRSPTLAPLIVELTISSYNEPNDGKHPKGAIISLLKAIPTLETLTLHTVRLNLPEATTIDSSRVKTLSITGSVFESMLHFHHLVLAFPCLDDLAVAHDVSWTSWDGMEVANCCAMKLNRLQFGVIDIEGSAITWLCHLLSVDVKTLSLKEMLPHWFEIPETFEGAMDTCILNARTLELDLRCLQGEHRT